MKAFFKALGWLLLGILVLLLALLLWGLTQGTPGADRQGEFAPPESIKDPVEHGYPATVRAVLYTDSSTQYVFIDEPTSIGGICTGKSRAYISDRDSSSFRTGMDNLICWESKGSNTILVTSEDGTGHQDYDLRVFDLVR